MLLLGRKRHEKKYNGAASHYIKREVILAHKNKFVECQGDYSEEN